MLRNMCGAGYCPTHASLALLALCASRERMSASKSLRSTINSFAVGVSNALLLCMRATA